MEIDRIDRFGYIREKPFRTVQNNYLLVFLINVVWFLLCFADDYKRFDVSETNVRHGKSFFDIHQNLDS